MVFHKRGGGRERDSRWHVVADGEKGNARWAGLDKVEEGLGVVDGGGVEAGGDGLGEGSHRQEHKRPRDPTQVLRPPRPLHYPPSHPAYESDRPIRVKRRRKKGGGINGEAAEEREWSFGGSSPLPSGLQFLWLSSLRQRRSKRETRTRLQLGIEPSPV